MQTDLLTPINYKNKIDPMIFIQKLESLQSGTQSRIESKYQSKMGQFFTSASVGLFMAGMFSQFASSIELLDPGAGVGMLSTAFVIKAISTYPQPKKIRVTAFELDPSLINQLKKNLEFCLQLCEQSGIDFNFEIINQDFISASVEVLSGKNSLFPVEQPIYNYAILNPPYKKINSGSITNKKLRSINIDTTNMYSAFMWLVMRLILPGSEMVAIAPRSFCNGTYFKPFRKELLETMAIKRIHIFESRDKAFKDGNVLQENIILHAVKGKDSQSTTIISSNDNPTDDDLITQEVANGQLVHPDDPDYFIRIVQNGLGHQINNRMDNLTTSLKDLGITVSTGQVVDFRSRELLRDKPDEETIPLIYPCNFQGGYIKWPLEKTKKPEYLSSSKESDRLTIPARNYVLVKRFSSKEEKRRVYAAIFNPTLFPVKRIGIENHVNYFHMRYDGLSSTIAKGLALYLNSSIVDQYFRQFSGHTQVNAMDLRNLKYPTQTQLLLLGDMFAEQFPDQDEIDKIISEVLILNGDNGEFKMNDPIQAKKRIKEALNILQSLNVPKAQQNDRSALTILALANIKIETPWQEATENLVGITEMMDYFNSFYGINYAPNTRETVRRQTIHQFIQLGLVIANPDDPERPINSPKTKYLIDSKTLSLLKSFNTNEWEVALGNYLKAASSLGQLQLKERSMPMIPISLPDGGTIYLSSGGQNELIKQIVEEFCPRYTPGGRLVYIGDAGEKLTQAELDYFEKLGMHLNKHGKMPDVVIDLADKKWLILIEAVTSHGPIDIKRYNELKSLFGGGDYGLVYVTAFESRKAMHKYLNDIAWETDVWVSETPSHLIHFNGERFLGPYPD